MFNKILKGKWGWNIPLLVNMIILLLIIISTSLTQPSDEAVISNIETDPGLQDKPFLQFRGVVGRYSVGFEENLVDFYNYVSNIEGINQSKSLFTVSHNDNITLDNQAYFVDIFYLPQAEWDKLTDSPDIELLTYNAEFDLTSNTTQFSSEFEEKQFEFNNSNIQEVQVLDDLYFTNNEFVSTQDHIILMPFDKLESKIYDTSLAGEGRVYSRWNVMYKGVVNYEPLLEYDKIEDIEDYFSSLEQKVVNKWQELYDHSYQTSSPLINRLYTLKSIDRNLEYGLNVFAPILILIQVITVYYLFTIITEKRERMDLLYVRGMSFKKITLSFLSYTLILPTIITFIVAVFFYRTTTPTSLAFQRQISPVYMWLSLQIPIIAYLSLREIRFLRIRLVTHSGIKLPDIPIKIWHLFGVISGVFLIWAINSFYRFNNQPLEGDVSILFRLPLHYSYLSISLIGLITMLLFYTIDNSADISSKQPIQYSFSLKVIKQRIIIAVLIFTLAFTVTTLSTTSTYYNNHFSESTQAPKDAQLHFYDSSQLVSNISILENLSDLGIYLPIINFRGRVSSDSFDFSTIRFNLLNQTLLDDYLESYDMNSVSLEDDIFFDPEFVDYLVDHRINPVINDKNIDISKIKALDGTLESFTPYRHNLFASISTWNDLGLQISGELRVLLNLDTTLSRDEIEDFISNELQISSNTFNLIIHSEGSARDWPDTIFDDTASQFTMYAMVISTIIIIFWLQASFYVNDLSIVKTRYGRALTNKSKDYMVLQSLLICTIGIIAGMIYAFTFELRTSELFSINGIEYHHDLNLLNYLKIPVLFILEIFVFTTIGKYLSNLRNE